MKDDNNFVFPNYNDNYNFIDLVKTMYSKIGIKGNDYKSLNNLIPNNNHYLFILCDGMGSNLIDRLQSNNTLKKNKKMDLVTVFPSTTGCVLTSLATAEFPSIHGIWGWFNYNREYNLNYYPVLFSKRDDKSSLIKNGIKRSDLFKCKSLLKSKSKYNINILFSNKVVDSEYSKFVAYKKNRKSYSNYNDIVRVMNKITLDNEKTFTYLYISDIDKLEHEYGTSSSLVYDKLDEINKLILELLKIKNLTIVITADHGQTNVSKEIVFDYEKYNKYLYTKPTIDCGTMSYFVIDKYKEEFEKKFRKEYKNSILYSTECLEKNGYFGNKLSKYARNCLGNYISVCKEEYYMISSDINEKKEIKGNHSGLLKDEMIIPLIVIDSNKI